MNTPTRLELALSRAAQGIPVFPLSPNTKFPIAGCTKCSRKIWVDGEYVKNPNNTCKDGSSCECIADGNPQGHTCHGCYAGTTNENVIRRWFQKHPEMNYGEHLVNQLIIDDDWDGPGENPAFVEYRERHGDFPTTRVVKTPGGQHRDYLLPEGTDLYRGAAAFGRRLLGRKANDHNPTKVDVKGGTGHYSVGVGSVVNGVPYTLLLDAQTIAYPLLHLLDKRQAESDRPEPGEYLGVHVTLDELGSFERGLVQMWMENIITDVRNAMPGDWNGTVYFKSADAGKYLAHGLFDEAEITEALVEAAMDSGLEDWQQPDDEEDVFNLVERGLSYGMAQGLSAELLESFGLSVTETSEESAEASAGSEQLEEPKKLLTLGDRLNACVVDWESLFTEDFNNLQYLTGGFAIQGNYISIIGDGKVGKSVFCHDWAWRIATGQPFLGDKEEHEPLPVLYLDKENARPTLLDHFRSYGADPSNFGQLTLMSFPPVGGLDTQEGGKVFVELVKQTGAKVVFLDTISRFIEGDENENNTWLRVYRYAIVPLKEHDDQITIVRIDHFGKDKTKGGRGGSAKEQDVDNVYELKKANAGTFELSRTHTRTGLGPDSLGFYRRGRVLDTMWAPGETKHEIIPAWKVRPANSQEEETGPDKTTLDGMVKLLDLNCIPDGDKGWGLNKTTEWLRDNGCKGSTKTMEDAQRTRKLRSSHQIVCDGSCDSK
ncbi:AAA family ATPase [Streptomyces sp. LARHCF252]